MRNRDGHYEVIRPSLERRLAMDAFAALPPSHMMVALLELDVTDALSAIAAQRERGTRMSLFAFLVRAIAVAISEHPDLNLVCHGRKLVRFEDVDVSVPLEVSTPEGEFPREVIIRRAQARGVADIYAELEAARMRQRETGSTGAEDRFFRGVMRAVQALPRRARVGIIRRFMRSAFTIKRSAGTTLVTSVGKFASIPGFAFSFNTGPRAAAFAVGSVVERPWVRGHELAVRSVVSIAVMVNHDLLDGAPAARFARRLQELIESSDGLDLADSTAPSTISRSPLSQTR